MCVGVGVGVGGWVWVSVCVCVCVFVCVRACMRACGARAYVCIYKDANSIAIKPKQTALKVFFILLFVLFFIILFRTHCFNRSAGAVAEP